MLKWRGLHYMTRAGDRAMATPIGVEMRWGVEARRLNDVAPAGTEQQSRSGDATGASDSGPSSSATAVVVIGVVVIAALLLGGLLMTRRRSVRGRATSDR